MPKRDKPRKITTRLVTGGWRAVMIHWSHASNMWIIWCESDKGPFPMREEATEDGKAWAIQDKLEFLG